MRYEHSVPIVDTHITIPISHAQGNTSTLTFHPIIEDAIKKIMAKTRTTFIDVSIAISAPQIHEEYILLSDATPPHSIFNRAGQKNIIWDYRYLFPIDTGEHCFYLVTIPQYILLPYKLLCIKNGWQLRIMTSYTAALLHYYEWHQAKQFRRIELGKQMVINQYMIDRIIEQLNYTRQLRPALIEASLIGLFITHKYLL